MKAKGSMFIEMIGVIGILAVIALAVTPLLKQTISVTPNNLMISQVTVTVNNAVNRIRADIEQASGLPQSFRDINADPNLALIETADNVVSYQLLNERLVRKEPAWAKDPNDIDIQGWTVPGARFAFEPFLDNNEICALKVNTSVSHIHKNKKQDKWALNRLLFLKKNMDQ